MKTLVTILCPLLLIASAMACPATSLYFSIDNSSGSSIGIYCDEGEQTYYYTLPNNANRTCCGDLGISLLQDGSYRDAPYCEDWSTTVSNISVTGLESSNIVLDSSCPTRSQ